MLPPPRRPLSMQHGLEFTIEPRNEWTIIVLSFRLLHIPRTVYFRPSAPRGNILHRSVPSSASPRRRRTVSCGMAACDPHVVASYSISCTGMRSDLRLERTYMKQKKTVQMRIIMDGKEYGGVEYKRSSPQCFDMDCFAVRNERGYDKILRVTVTTAEFLWMLTDWLTACERSGASNKHITSMICV